MITWGGGSHERDPRGMISRLHEFYISTYPWCTPLNIQDMYDLVLLDILDLRHHTKLVDGVLGEATGVALDMAVIHLTDAGALVSGKAGFGVDSLEEVEMVVHPRRVEVVLQHNNIRVIERLVWNRSV